MYIKKFLIISSLILFLNGCTQSSDNSEFTVDSEELLTSSTWYKADVSADKFFIRRFTSNQLIEYRYESGRYENLIESNIYQIEYQDQKLILYDGPERYTCSVSTCEEKTWMVLDCTADYDAVDSKLFCGWNSKYEALLNK